jgi:hypothetical protein
MGRILRMLSAVLTSGAVLRLLNLAKSMLFIQHSFPLPLVYHEAPLETTCFVVARMVAAVHPYEEPRFHVERGDTSF